MKNWRTELWIHPDAAGHCVRVRSGWSFYYFVCVKLAAGVVCAFTTRFCEQSSDVCYDISSMFFSLDDARKTQNMTFFVSFLGLNIMSEENKTKIETGCYHCYSINFLRSAIFKKNHSKWTDRRTLLKAIKITGTTNHIHCHGGHGHFFTHHEILWPKRIIFSRNEINRNFI